MSDTSTFLQDCENTPQQPAETKKRLLKLEHKQDSETQQVTKEMVEYWLEENYHKWIANVIVDICNEPHDIEHLKKQIKEEWERRDK